MAAILNWVKDPESFISPTCSGDILLTDMIDSLSLKAEDKKTLESVFYLNQFYLVLKQKKISETFENLTEKTSQNVSN